MANILMIFSKIVWILYSVVLTILIWKTAEYFNSLPENDKHKPLLAWDALMLSCMLISYIMRLITT